MTLDHDLQQFTGTQQYYRHFTGLLYTDGIHYLAEHAQCHWLIDLVGSYQHTLRDIPFQLWQIVVDDNTDSAVVTMREDTDQPTGIRQDIPYTDFPLEDFSWYCIDNVMLLKSEY